MSNNSYQMKLPTFDWKPLQDAFTDVVTAINANRPVEGSGIRVTGMGDMGSLIECGPGGAGGPSEDISTTPDGQTAGWHQISVVVVDPVLGCIEQVIWYWGTAPFS